MILGVLQLLAVNCSDRTFFGIPPWYHTLVQDIGGSCGVKISNINDIWVIVANVVREALALAGFLAVIFMIYGGVTYITSNGNPEAVKRAGSILTNSIMGLIIAIIASFIVSFIAGIFT